MEEAKRTRGTETLNDMLKQMSKICDNVRFTSGNNQKWNGDIYAILKVSFSLFLYVSVLSQHVYSSATLLFAL